jgi:flagellar protein FlaG
MLIQNLSASVTQMPQTAKAASDSAPSVDNAIIQATAPQATAPQATTPQVTATQVAEKAVPAAQLQNAVQNANLAMQASNRDLTFSVDTDTKQTVVKLMDSKTGDVIGQFPTHQMLEISKAIGLMQEQLQQATLSKAPVQSTPSTQGLLIKQQA